MPTPTVDHPNAINQTNDLGVEDTPDQRPLRRNSPGRQGFRKLAKRLGPMVAAGASQEATSHRASRRASTVIADSQQQFSGHQYSTSTSPSDQQVTQFKKPLLSRLKLVVSLVSGDKLNIQLPKNIDIKQVKVSGNGEQLWILSKKGTLYQFNRGAEGKEKFQYNQAFSALLNQGNNRYQAIEAAQDGTLYSVDNVGYLYQAKHDKGVTSISRSSEASFAKLILQDKVSAKGRHYQQIKPKLDLALVQGHLKVLSNGVEQGSQTVQTLLPQFVRQAAGIYTAADGQRWLLENNQLFKWNASQQQWESGHDKAVSQLRVGGDGQLYALSEWHEILRLNNNSTASVYRLTTANKLIQDFTVQQNQQIAFIDTDQNYSFTSTADRLVTTPVVLPDKVKATALINNNNERWLLGENQQLYRVTSGSAQPQVVGLPDGVDGVIRFERVMTDAGPQLQIAAKKDGRLQQYVYVNDKWQVGTALDSAALFVNSDGLSKATIGHSGFVQTREGERYAIHNGELHYQRAGGDDRWHSTGVHNLSQLRLGGDGQLYALRGINELVTINQQTKSVQYGLPAAKHWGNDRQQTQFTPDSLTIANHVVSDFTVGRDGQIHFLDHQGQLYEYNKNNQQANIITPAPRLTAISSNKQGHLIGLTGDGEILKQTDNHWRHVFTSSDQKVLGLNQTSTGELAVVLENQASGDSQLVIHKTLSSQGQLVDIPQEAIVDKLFQRLKQQDADQVRLPGTGLTAKGNFAFVGVESGNPSSEGINKKDYLTAHLYHKKTNWLHWPRPLKAIGYHFQHRARGREGLTPLYSEIGNSFNQLIQHLSVNPSEQQPTLSARIEQAFNVGRITQEQKDQLLGLKQQLEADTLSYLTRLGKKKGLLTESGEVNQQFTGNTKAKIGRFLNPRITSHDLTKELNQLWESYQGDESNSALSIIKQQLTLMQEKGLYLRHPGQNNGFTRRDYDDNVGLLTARVVHNSNTLADLDTLIKVINGTQETHFKRDEVKQLITELQDSYDSSSIKKFSDMGFSNLDRLESSYDAVRFFSKAFSKTHHPVYQNALNTFGSETPEQLKNNLYDAITHLKKGETLTFDRNYSGGSSPFFIINKLQQLVSPIGIELEPGVKAERHYGLSFEKTDKGIKVAFVRDMSIPANVTAGGYFGTPGVASARVGGILNPTLKHDKNNQLAFEIDNGKVEQFLNDLTQGKLKPTQLLAQGHDYAVKRGHKWGFDLDLQAVAEARLTGSGSTASGENTGTDGVTDVNGWARAKGGIKFTLNVLSANKDWSTTTKDNGEQTQSHSSNRPRFFTKAGLDVEATSHFKLGVDHDEFSTNALSYSAGAKWSGSVESKTSKSYDVTAKPAEQVKLTEWQAIVGQLQTQFKDDLTSQQQQVLNRVANSKSENEAGAAEAIKQLQGLDLSQALIKLDAADGDSRSARQTLQQLESLTIQQQLADQGKYTISDVSFGKTMSNLSRLDERSLLGWAGAQFYPNQQQPSSSRTLHEWMEQHPELKTLVNTLKQSDATEAKITMELTEHAKLQVARLMASNDPEASIQLSTLLNDRTQFRIKSIEVSASAKNNSAFGQSIGLANFKSAAATSIKKKLGKISFNYDNNRTTPNGYQLDGELLTKTPQQLQTVLNNFEQTHQQRLLNVADSVNQHNMNALVADPVQAARAALLGQLSVLGINQVTPTEVKGMAQRTQELFSQQLSADQQASLTQLINDPVDNRATALKQVTGILAELKQQQPKLNPYQQQLYQRAHLASQRHADVTRLLTQTTNQVASTESQAPGTILQFVRGRLAYQNRLLTQTEAMQVVRHFGDQILQKMQSGYSGFATFAGESPFNGEAVQRIVQRQENAHSIQPRIGQSPRLCTLKVGDLIHLLISGELTLNRLNPAQRLLINEYFPGDRTSQQHQLQTLADNPAKLAAIIHQANQFSPAELVASDRLTGPTGQRGLAYLLSWDQFVLEGATKFKQQVAPNAKVNFAPQSLYVQLSQSNQPKGRCTGLAMAYLQLLSQDNGVAKKNKLFETLVIHSAIYQQSMDEGISNKEVADANQFAALIDQLHATSQTGGNNNPLQAVGDLTVRDLVSRLAAKGDQYLVLNTGNHSLAVAKKGEQFFFYDPNFADVEVASTTNLQQVLTKHLNLSLSSQANQSLAQLYQTKQTHNKPTFSVFQLNSDNTALAQQAAKLNQFVNTEQLMTERDRLAQLGEAEFNGQKIKWTTLYDMGASVAGRRLTAVDVQTLQQAGNVNQLQFDRSQLGEFVTQRVQTLDNTLTPAAQWLKTVIQQRGSDSTQALLTHLTEGQETTIADDFINAVDRHINSQLNVAPDFWQSLTTKLKATSHLATANAVSNKVGKGLQGYGYYQNIMGIFNALRRSNQPGVDQSEINKEIGLAAGGLAADLLEPLAEKGLQKAGLSLVNRFGPSASTAGKFASKLGTGLMRAGGAVLGVLTSGFDIYSAVDSFKKLASETDPKKRQDLIVNGSLSVSGAVVGIATAIAIGIGGTAAAVAGPIGVAAAAILAIGGQIYSAVRQIDEIDDYISLTAGERLRNGWYAFWGKELDEDVVRRYGLAKAKVEGRKLFDKGLREGSVGQLDNMQDTVDTVVYSKGKAEVKETKYYERVRRESSGGYAGIGRVWYENVARYKHEPTLEESDDNVDLSNGVTGHAQIRYYQNQTDEQGDQTKKEVAPRKESYRVKVGSRPVGKLGMAPVYETRTREVTPNHDVKVKSFENAGSNTAAVQATQQSDNKAAFINLGTGKDTAKGFTNKRNIFVVGEGEKSFTGGKKDDAFILSGGAAPNKASQLTAGEGNDTVIAQGDLTDRTEDTGYKIDLQQGEVHYRGSNKKVATISGFENAIGQAKTADELIGNDQTNTLNGNGGGDTLKAGGGNDILFLHGGDHAEGGQGIDTYYVTRSKGEVTVKEEAGLTEVNALYLDYDINEMGAARLEGNDILMDFTGDNNEKLTLRFKDAYKTLPNGTKQLQNQFSMVTRDGFLVVPEWAATISSQRPFNPTMAASFVAARQNPDNIQKITQDLSGNQAKVQVTANDGTTKTYTIPEFTRLIPTGWQGDDVMVGGNKDDVFMLDQGNDQATGNQGQDTYIIGRNGDTTANPAEKVINNIAIPVQASDVNSQASYEQDYLVLAGVRRDNILLTRHNDDLLVKGLKDNGHQETVRIKQFFKGEAYQHISIVDEKGGQSAIELDKRGNAVLSKSTVITGTNSADDLYTTEREQGSYTLTGEAGDDRLQAKHTVVSHADSYTLTDGDILIGGAGNDTLRDSLADDVLIGGEDDDIIISSWGDDQIDTGTGRNQVRFASNAQGVKVVNANNSEQTTLWVPFALKEATYRYEQNSFIIEGKAPHSEDNKTLTIILPDYLQHKPKLILKSYDGSQVEGEMPNQYSAMAHGAVTLNQGGNDQYLTLENSPLAGLDEFTVQMSFKSDRQQLSGRDYVPLMSYAGSRTANEFLLGVYPGGLNVWIKGKQYTTAVKANELLDGQYHDVTTSWNNNTGKLAIYVDGQLRDSVTTEHHGKLDSVGRFIIGQEQDQLNGGFDKKQYFQGSLGDVKILNRQLTPTEAAQAHGSEQLAHWNFNYNWSDLSANRYDLQLARVAGFTQAIDPYLTWEPLTEQDVYEEDQLHQLAELYKQLDKGFF
ncbi:AvrE-family type 3 secretion system effector [Endozoicomonas sp. SM1973]|uniref:AvrE-family type 3 secretion system effector n=1 Tax=Spartinivicinus marinus TaxID=2994442 RepID=A0A853IC71_9GAMM|nr:AvrE-family type 3 secretion system effector [Spartinivicinus marinus]MCX4029319.1 AvrE-family type 3 secretion system effector [Spartinivicinus marinus]NYZ68158.1 AvrE-family type 3 secretion system effector [Spartinivicinus marinus]